MTQENKDRHTIMMLESRIKSLEKEVIKYKYDHLTGLPVRIDFQPLYEAFMHDQIMFQKPFILAIVDINNLKIINDNEGYLVGDSVIISVSQALSHLLHDSNIFRIGGDEFAILSRTETVDSLYKKLENTSNIESKITVGAAVSTDYESCSDMFTIVDRLMKSKKINGR
jgi:diguanylate cyclase (GGDEF)-like protein